jgi:hypothetical protein
MTDIDDVRYDLRIARHELSDAAFALRQEVAGRVSTLANGVDPRHHAQSHPWLTLAVVFGAGVAIAISEADRKAAGAAAAGAAKAVGAAGEAIGSARETVANKLRRDSDDEVQLVSTDDRPSVTPVSGGFADRMQMAVVDLLETGVRDLLDGLNGGRSHAERQSSRLEA